MDNWFWCFWTCSEREINYLVPEILALVGLVLIPRVQVNKVQFDIIYTLPKLVGHLLWSENLALTESDIRSMQLISVGRVQRTPSFYFTTRSSNCPSLWKHLSDTTDCLNPTHSKWIFWNWCLFNSCGGPFPTVRHVGKQGITAKNCNLIVYHVLWSGTKFLIAFDHLVDSLQEVFLSHSFPTGSNCIHACLCAHTANIGTCTFNIHFLRVFGG